MALNTTIKHFLKRQPLGGSQRGIRFLEAVSRDEESPETDAVLIGRQEPVAIQRPDLGTLDAVLDAMKQDELVHEMKPTDHPSEPCPDCGATSGGHAEGCNV